VSECYKKVCRQIKFLINNIILGLRCVISNVRKYLCLHRIHSLFYFSPAIPIVDTNNCCTPTHYKKLGSSGRSKTAQNWLKKPFIIAYGRFFMDGLKPSRIRHRECHFWTVLIKPSINTDGFIENHLEEIMDGFPQNRP
jgi:hypothetical protein